MSEATVKGGNQTTRLYYAMIKVKSKSKNAWSWEFRYHMVTTAKEKGVSGAAREFKTTRPTVRKWLKRFNAQGSSGLFEISRRPKGSPNRTKITREIEIVALRKQYSRWGPLRLKDTHNLPESASTLGRIFKRNSLIHRRTRKWRQRKDLSKLKAQLRVFEKIQVDTKHLDDIANYIPWMSAKNLPRYEFTAKDVRTGGIFVAYSWAPTLENAKRFADEVLKHLRSYAVDLSRVTIQTDHGSEFDMAAPSRWVCPEKSAFVQTVQGYGAHYMAIPIKRPTFNSDVERTHGLIEEELYDLGDFRGLRELLGKSLAYCLYFNYRRKNRYKGKQSPVDILRTADPKLNDKVFAAWMPILLDTPKEIKEKEAKLRALKEEKGNQTILSLVDTMS